MARLKLPLGLMATMRMGPFAGRTDFLKALLYYGDSEERGRLLEKMLRAEREERWSRHAALSSVCVAALCCVGLPLLSAELVSLLEDTALVLVDVEQALGIASVLAVLVIGSWWLWNRGSLNRLQQEAARFALGLLESRAGRAATETEPSCREGGLGQLPRFG